VGARVWFARIMFTWGLVTLALGFTQNATMFYILRFLLGVTEAGFFPGVLYVLTLWYPQAHRGTMVGLFMIASAVANAVGATARRNAAGPGRTARTGGLAGWQWVFLVTGVPAVLLAPYVLYLPDGPEQAKWFLKDEKAWLAQGAGPSERGGEVDDHRGAWKAIFDPRVLLWRALIGMPLSAYGLSYWLPTIVKSFGVSNTVNGLINIIPWTLVAIALWHGAPPRGAKATAPAPGTSPAPPLGVACSDPERGLAWRGAEVRHAVHRRPGHLRGPARVLEPAAQLSQRRRVRRPASRRSTRSAISAASSPRTWCRWCATPPAATCPHAGPGRRAGGDQRADLLRHGPVGPGAGDRRVKMVGRSKRRFVEPVERCRAR
jgi:hypothetical protein